MRVCAIPGATDRVALCLNGVMPYRTCVPACLCLSLRAAVGICAPATFVP